MKKTLLASTLGALAFISFSSAFAADGTVNFNGTIIDTACRVDMGSSATLEVPMGKISTKSFSGSGSTSGISRFNLVLNGCPAATSAKVRFDGVAVCQ